MKKKKERKDFIYVELEFQKEILPIGSSPLTSELYRETIKSYIHGLYISSLLTGEAFIEKVIRDQIPESGRIAYNLLLEKAKEKEFINEEETVRLIEIHRTVRNLYAHESASQAGFNLTSDAVRETLAEDFLRIMKSLYTTTRSHLKGIFAPLEKNGVRGFKD